ncbi:MAG: PBECR2 nuclease fold domain-containing protein, partial [Pseudomonadales bacterium]
VMPVRYGSRPFAQAQDYLRNKIPLPTNGWEDVYARQHDHAFSVSGANKTAIVEDFLSAVRAAVEDGETLADFRKRFDTIVEQHGWDYHGSRGWRSKLIYETNVRQAYNAGREAQMAEPGFQALFPYAEYRHSGAEHYRPEHKSWNSLVLLINDPWWDTHSPSNGYGCKCKKFPKSERALRRGGKRTPDPTPEVIYKEHIDKRTGEVLQVPKGIDPGFEYRPGQSAQRHTTPRFIEEWPANASPIPIGPTKRPLLPEPTTARQRDILGDGLGDQAYVDAFMAEFGGVPTTFRDVLGEPLQISDDLFRTAAGELKVSKDKIRHRYMKLLAQALIAPDEVWAILEPDFSKPGKYRLKRRFIKRWVIEESGQPVHGFSAFEYGQGVWTGNTIFTPHRRRGKERIPEKLKYLEAMREGVLLYQALQQVEDSNV